MPDDPDGFTLATETGAKPRRMSSRELARQARVAKRGEATPEGLGFGATEYHVPGLEGGGRQPGLELGGRPADTPVIEPQPPRDEFGSPTGPAPDVSPAERLRVHLTEVTRDRMGRFVRLERLRECQPSGCNLDEPPPDVSGMLDQHLGFLESLRDTLEVASGQEARELAEVVDAYRLELEDQRENLTGQAGEDAFALAERTGRESYFVRGALEEVLDVSALDGRSRSRLALLLASWNKRHRRPFFKMRPDNGARVLARGPWSIDLAHPFIQQTGIAETALESIREDPDLWEVEEPGATDADRADEFAAEAEARGRARVRGEL